MPVDGVERVIEVILNCSVLCNRACEYVNGYLCSKEEVLWYGFKRRIGGRVEGGVEFYGFEATTLELGDAGITRKQQSK